MRRSAASGVSILSDFVANGRQALQPVSSSPSKIPYGGFSPVRLQIGRQPQPSPWPPTPPRLIGGPSPSGHRSSSPCGQSPHRVGVGASSLRTLRSRGPWLGVGLFCPVASSLTMASSEALGFSRRLMFFADGSLPCGRIPEIPQFKLRVCPSVPFAIPRRVGWWLTVRFPSIGVFAHFAEARHPRFST